VSGVKISVSSIPEEGLNLRFSKGRTWLDGVLSGGGDAVVCTRDVEVICHVKKLRENVFLEGTIVTALGLPCCRCLETATLPVDVSFRYTLTPVPEGQTAEIELTDEDLECGFYDEDTIDLDAFIGEQIILQIPIRVLCRDDCRGLCPRCGANFNLEVCTCPEKVVDERLAVLKKMKIEKK
jgi:uncharacterized protein